MNQPATKIVPKAHGSAISRIFTVGFGSFLGQIVLVLSTPVITRLYPPNVYAKWALGMGFIIIFGTVSTLRYELAIVLPTHKRHSANLLALSVFLATISGLVSAIALFSFEYPFRALFGIEKNVLTLVWIPTSITLTGVSQSCIHWFTREKDFRSLAFITFLSAMFMSAGPIIFFWLDFRGVDGLVLGSLMGQGLSALWALMIILFGNGMYLVKEISLSHLWAMAKTYQSYPLYITPYSLVSVLREKAPLFVLNLFGTTTMVGNFSLASRVMNFPVDFISGSVRPVLFQKASETNIKGVENFINELLAVLIKMSVPFWILFLFYYKELFIFFFGSAWGEAGLYAAILSIPAFAFLLSDWSDRLLDVMGRQKLALKLEAVFSVVGIVILCATLFLTGNFLYAVIVHGVVILTFNLYWLYTVYRHANFTIEHLKQMLGVFLLAGLSWGALLFVLGRLVPPIFTIVLYLIAVMFNSVVCFNAARNKPGFA